MVVVLRLVLRTQPRSVTSAASQTGKSRINSHKLNLKFRGVAGQSQNMTRTIILLCAVCLVPAQLPAQPDVPSDGSLSRADNCFGFDLLKEIGKEQPDQNIFISPYVISTALQMLSEGAAGKTKAEIQQALKTGDLPPAARILGFQKLMRSFSPQTNGTLNLAVGMWYQKHYRVKPAFADEIQDSFQAKLAAVDFDDPGSADLINEWADRETQGKINNIVAFPFPENTRLILANAIYFKDTWMEPFDQTLTKPRDFYLADGTTGQVPMMFKHDQFNYLEDDHFQAVQLPYQDGLQMLLFLPAPHTTPEQLLADFSSADWNDKISWFPVREGTLMFPRFKFDYDIALIDPLQKLGIKRAFDPNSADLSGMSDEPALYVNEMAQKSFVAVDEKGTEAAAVAVATVAAGGVEINPPKPFTMIVDRPFLFFITAWGPFQTQTILFMGIVTDPGKPAH